MRPCCFPSRFRAASGRSGAVPLGGGARITHAEVPGDGTTQGVTSGSVDYSTRVSPDGRWLAYQSRQTGRDEIWVRPFPDGENAVRLTDGGGRNPLWASDMSELLYRVGTGVRAVEIQTTPTFVVGAHRKLFDGPYAVGVGQPRTYDVHPSGEEFVMTKIGAWGGRLVMVQNFFAELKDKVGS